MGCGASTASNQVGGKVTTLHSKIRWFDSSAAPDEKQAKLEGIIALLPKFINVADAQNGNVALHIASQNGHFEVVDLLVSRGATLSPQNRGGNTPLHMATEYGFNDVALLLRSKGADPLIKNDEGCTAETGIDGEKEPIKADNLRDAE